MRKRRGLVRKRRSLVRMKSQKRVMILILQASIAARKLEEAWPMLVVQVSTASGGSRT